MRAARVDGNQGQIVRALRAIGVSVAITSTVGDGFPDLVCGYRGVSYLLEIKDPEQPPSKRKLTEDQERFHLMWNGQIAVVESVDDAYAVLGIKRGA